MYIIDKTKEEFKDVPDSLEGEVLLEATKDSQGNISGYLTIKPDYLKHFAETKTIAELKVLGFENYQIQLDFVKGKSEIVAKKPEGL